MDDQLNPILRRVAVRYPGIGEDASTTYLLAVIAQQELDIEALREDVQAARNDAEGWKEQAMLWMRLHDQAGE